jgi:hypothetical protein
VSSEGGTGDAGEASVGDGGASGGEAGVTDGSGADEALVADSSSEGGGEASVTSDSGQEGAAPLTPTLLYSFDLTGNAGTAGWTLSGPNVTGTLSLVLDDVNSCSTSPGALEAAVTFNGPADAADTTAYVRVDFNPNVDWTGRKKLHLFVKLQDPNQVLQAFQPWIQAGPTLNYAGLYSGYTGASAISDGLWHEFILDISNQTFLSSILNITVHLFPNASALNGATPASVVFDIDNVLLE